MSIPLMLVTVVVASSGIVTAQPLFEAHCVNDALLVTGAMLDLGSLDLHGIVCGPDVRITAHLVALGPGAVIRTPSGANGGQVAREASCGEWVSLAGAAGGRGGDLVIDAAQIGEWKGRVALGNGGHGGDVSVSGCGSASATAKGGEGGRSGQLVFLRARPTSSVIDGGVGGAGGAAQVVLFKRGQDGQDLNHPDGESVEDRQGDSQNTTTPLAGGVAVAIGGNGALGTMVGGRGGWARAVGGRGGSAIPFEDSLIPGSPGGCGGNATALGGMGGNGRDGGGGGDANATAGAGGHGADVVVANRTMPAARAGNGGCGGRALAVGGNGHEAQLGTGGDAGNATARAGGGGDGGWSLGTGGEAGDGGDGGNATAVGGNGGNGTYSWGEPGGAMAIGANGGNGGVGTLVGGHRGFWVGCFALGGHSGGGLSIAIGITQDMNRTITAVGGRDGFDGYSSPLPKAMPLTKHSPGGGIGIVATIMGIVGWQRRFGRRAPVPKARGAG